MDALNRGCDYLIFTMDAKKHRVLIGKILSRKKPRLILQNITTPYKEWKSNQPFLYVGFDHALGSKILAKSYIEKVGKSGKYAVLFGPVGYVSDMRGNTFIEYIEKNSNLKMVESYYVGFDRKKARKATIDLLSRHKDIKFIYACSTDIALGAMDALKETGLDKKIMVNGWGGGSAELEAIQKGELEMTVMRMNDDNGVAMAEAIKMAEEGKGGQVPTLYSGSFELVERGVSKSRLDALKARAFRYSKQMN